MRRLGQAGVTLLELLVAMVLLAVALVGLAASFPYAMYGVTAGGYQTTATLLGQQVVDQAKATRYAAVNSLATGGWSQVYDDGGNVIYDGFRRRVTVVTTNNAGPPVQRYKTLTVEVEFVGVVPSPIYVTTLSAIITD